MTSRTASAHGYVRADEVHRVRMRSHLVAAAPCVAARAAGARRMRRRCRPWIPPPPSFGWFSSSKKLGPLPEFTGNGHAESRVAGRHRQGGAGSGARGRSATRSTPPATNGALVRVDPADGRDRVAHRGGQARVGGAPARTRRSSPSAPTRATCSPSARTASRCGRSKVTSEVVSPPKVAEGIVVVWSGDGRDLRRFRPPTARRAGSTSAAIRR